MTKIINCNSKCIYLDIYDTRFDIFEINLSQYLKFSSIELYINDTYIDSTFKYSININSSNNIYTHQCKIYKYDADEEDYALNNTIDLSIQQNNMMESYKYSEPTNETKIDKDYNIKVCTLAEYESLTEYEKNTLYFIKK